MPKYSITVTFHSEEFTLDTDDEYHKEFFAKTKDELVDKLDPNDPDVIANYIQEALENQDITAYDVPDIDQVAVVRKN